MGKTQGVDAVNKASKDNPHGRERLQRERAALSSNRLPVMLWSALGAGLMFASLPPLHWSWLGWIALVPWMRLVYWPAPLSRGQYAVFYLGCFCFYLASLYWLFLPYWATGIGGVCLAAYFAVYPVLVVNIVRKCRERGVTPLFAAPIVWAAGEFLRGNLFCGMNMVELANSQYRLPVLIQVVDIAGSYTLSALMTLCSIGTASVFFGQASARRWGIAACVMSIVFTLGYGALRLRSYQPSPGVNLLLVQGVVDNQFAESEEEAEAHWRTYERGFERYCALTLEGLRAHPDAQLIVWPESINIYDWFSHQDGARTSSHKPDWIALEEDRKGLMRSLAQTWNRPALIGGGRHLLEASGERRRFNSAVLFNSNGEFVQAYDKMHRVPFGEYIPGAKAAPWLYNFSPLATGIERGAAPITVHAGEARASVSICFESVVPRIIQSQTGQLAREKKPANLLVNITNDGWFWGSSEHELHLSCAVLRAVENRLPMAVAANCGISACIAANGAILAEASKRTEQALYVQAPLGNLSAPFSYLGQKPAMACLAITIWLAWPRRRVKSSD